MFRPWPVICSVTGLSFCSCRRGEHAAVFARDDHQANLQLIAGHDGSLSRRSPRNRPARIFALSSEWNPSNDRAAFRVVLEVAIFAAGPVWANTGREFSPNGSWRAVRSPVERTGPIRTCRAACAWLGGPGSITRRNGNPRERGSRFHWPYSRRGRQNYYRRTSGRQMLDCSAYLRTRRHRGGQRRSSSDRTSWAR